MGEQWNFPAKPVAHLGFDREGNLWVLSGRRSLEAPTELHVLPAREREFRRAGGERFVRGFTWDADQKVVTSRDARAPAGGSFIAWESPSPHHPILRRSPHQVLDRANGAGVFTLDDRSFATPVAIRFPP